MHVNTARSDFDATICSVKPTEVTKAQGARLAAARLAAGYSSARDAALSNRWAESTYRAHETGNRTIGLDDAAKYVKRFQAAGVKITAKEIIFGTDEIVEEDANSPADARSSVPIMGYIGAGASIEPEF